MLISQLLIDRKKMIVANKEPPKIAKAAGEIR